MTFWEHVESLRVHLLLGGGAFIATAIALFTWSEEIMIHFLLRPLSGEELVFLSPLGPLLFEIKLAFMGALIVCLPLWLLLLSHFVGGGFSLLRQLTLYLYILAAALLAAGAVALSVFYLIPVSLAALAHFVIPGTSLMLTAESYLSFSLLTMAVAFLVLEIPVVIITLAHIGLLDPALLRRQRRVIFIATLVVLGILTPTADPVTLLTVAIPAMLLTELGILVAHLVYTGSKRESL